MEVRRREWLTLVRSLSSPQRNVGAPILAFFCKGGVAMPLIAGWRRLRIGVVEERFLLVRAA
jgi:hypothetical protein